MVNDAEKIIQAFPNALKNNVLSLIGKTVFKGAHSISTGFEVVVNDERLIIPDRIYFEEPMENNLTEAELLILNCLYTRHHDGFVRQRRLERILISDEYWITPFIIQLLGEYVNKILLTIEHNLSDQKLHNFTRFIRENSVFFETVKSRVISYWNCYYRAQFPKKEDYARFRILAKISQSSNI